MTHKSRHTDDQVLGVLWGLLGTRRGVSKDKPQRAWVCLHMCHGTYYSPRQRLTGHQHSANCWTVGLRGLSSLPPNAKLDGPCGRQVCEVTLSNVVKIAMKSQTPAKCQQHRANGGSWDELLLLNPSVFKQEPWPCARTYH